MPWGGKIKKNSSRVEYLCQLHNRSCLFTSDPPLLVSHSQLSPYSSVIAIVKIKCDRRLMAGALTTVEASVLKGTKVKKRT